MAESIYDQVLEFATDQIVSLLSGETSPLLKPERLEPREFNWLDIASYPGLSLRFTNDAPVSAQNMAPTNSHNPIGFPVYLVMNSPDGDMIRGTTTKAFELFKQKVRQYYNHRRRMEDVASEGVLSAPSTVRDGGPQPPKDFTGKIQMQTITFWFFEPQTP